MSSPVALNKPDISQKQNSSHHIFYDNTKDNNPMHYFFSLAMKTFSQYSPPRHAFSIISPLDPDKGLGPCITHAP